MSLVIEYQIQSQFRKEQDHLSYQYSLLYQLPLLRVYNQIFYLQKLQQSIVLKSHTLSMDNIINKQQLLSTNNNDQDSYWEIVKNGFPTSISIICEIVILTINISKLSDSAAKAGLGVSGVLVHALGGSFIFGLNYGYGIFGARAFGAKNVEKYKQYFVQGLTNLIALVILFIFICFLSYRLSILTGQDQIVSLYTYKFIVYILPGYTCFYCSHFIRLYLNSQNIYSPNFFVDLFGIIFHIVNSWILSFFIEKETLIYVSTNITLITYFLTILFVERKLSIWKLSMDLFNVKQPFENYKHFLVQCCFVGVPYALAMFIFQLMALYVGSFKNTSQTAAHVIVTNMNTLMVSPYLGFSLYMTTRIGNFIGQNKSTAVLAILKKIIKFSIVLIYIIYAVVMFCLEGIMQFYTSDESVKSYIRPALHFFIIFFVFDILQNSSSQFCKPIGYGQWITKVYVLSFYLIGFGVTVIMARFLQSKILASWSGLFVGSIVLTVFCFLKIRSLNMPQLVQQLHDKVKIKKDLNTELNDLTSQ